MVVFVLRFAQLAVHDQAADILQIGQAAFNGGFILALRLAQHPVGQIIVGVRLGAHAHADAREFLAAKAGNDAF